MATDIEYIRNIATDPRVVPTQGTRNKFSIQINDLVERFGSSIPEQHKLQLMYEIVSNSPIAFRRAGQFGEDPEILTLFTPAGSAQISRLPYNDETLAQYSPYSSFSIVSFAEAIGDISDTFNTNPGILPQVPVPTSLTSIIGNVAKVNLDGSTPVAVSSITSKIGEDVELNAAIPDRSNIISAINSVFAQKVSFLLSFCNDHAITHPAASTFMATMVSDVLKVILDDSLTVSGGGGDDMTKCILGAAKISSGTPASKTVTRNACPNFDDPNSTCDPPSGTYTTKADCITGTNNYFTSLNVGTAINIFTEAINDPTIKPILVGEICAQYPG